MIFVTAKRWQYTQDCAYGVEHAAEVTGRLIHNLQV